MFTLAGTLLAAFGLSTRGNPDVYTRSLGIDLNVWWGFPLMAFGILMLALGRRGQMKMEKPGTKGPGTREQEALIDVLLYCAVALKRIVL